MDLSLWLNNQEFKLSLEERGQKGLEVRLGRERYRVSTEFIGSEEVLLNIDGKVYDILLKSNSTSYSIWVKGRLFEVGKKTASRMLGRRAEKQRRAEVRTSMPGRIIKVLAEAGQKVKEGQAVLILEAMKMQNEIRSPQSGTLVQVIPKAGEPVEANSLLFTLD